MSVPGTAARVVRVAAGVVLGGLLVASCGGGAATSPPAVLQAALRQVDAAVAAHDPARARLALDVLVARTLTARDQGLISAEQADRVLAAASTLRVDLPVPEPTAAPTSPASQEGDGERGRGRGRGKEHDD